MTFPAALLQKLFDFLEGLENHLPEAHRKRACANGSYGIRSASYCGSSQSPKKDSCFKSLFFKSLCHFCCNFSSEPCFTHSRFASIKTTSILESSKPFTTKLLILSNCSSPMILKNLGFLISSLDLRFSVFFSFNGFLPFQLF